MKTYYRKAPGCFIYTDVYYRPSRVPFSAVFFLALVASVLLSTFI